MLINTEQADHQRLKELSEIENKASREHEEAKKNRNFSVMAIARLSVKVGRKGSAGKHACYIAREGQYASRLEKGEKLEATEYGNIPSWSAHDPSLFWHCADALERKNGTAYREFEIALPRELSSEQRIALVQDFCQQEIGEKHAYQWAIHVPTAADGGEQPHCHLMFSERLNDGIHRDPTQYFKQYNAKVPDMGGAQKAALGVTGYQSPQQRKEALLELRERWENTCNNHLAMAQKTQRIDMRSYQTQGLDRQPERKMMPSEWRDPEQRQTLVEYRTLRKEQHCTGSFSQCWSATKAHQVDTDAQPAMQSARQHFHLSHGANNFIMAYQSHKDHQEKQAQQQRLEQERQLRAQQEQQRKLELERQQQQLQIQQQEKEKQRTRSHGMSMGW